MGSSIAQMLVFMVWLSVAQILVVMISFIVHMRVFVVLRLLLQLSSVMGIPRIAQMLFLMEFLVLLLALLVSFCAAVGRHTPCLCLWWRPA